MVEKTLIKLRLVWWRENFFNQPLKVQDDVKSKKREAFLGDW